MKSYSEELNRRLESPKAKGLKFKPSARNELLFKTKPKIPKSGTTIYDGFYIRKLDGTELVYHIESGLFVARMNKQLREPMEARVWIDENFSEILKRVKEVTDVEI